MDENLWDASLRMKRAARNTTCPISMPRLKKRTDIRSGCTPDSRRLRALAKPWPWRRPKTRVIAEGCLTTRLVLDLRAGVASLASKTRLAAIRNSVGPEGSTTVLLTHRRREAV